MRTAVRRRPDRVRAEWGMVLDVREVFVSRRVAADAAAGASSVALRSGSIFEGSGWVRIADRASGQVVAYTADADGVLSLADPLAEALVEGDEVFLYDRGRRAVVADFEAEVDVPEWDGAPVPAHIGPAYHDTLPVGAREEGEGEVVRIEYDPDDDLWSIDAVPGLAEVTGPKWESREPHYTPTTGELAAGTFTHQLLHDRIVGTHEFAVTINGVDLGFEWWTLDADAGVVTVTIPAWCEGSGAEDGGDEFMFPPYAYLSGPRPPQPSPEIVNTRYVVTGISGGTYATIPLPDGTQVGDVIVGGLICSVTSSFDITDPRLSLVHPVVLNPGSSDAITFHGVANTLDDLVLNINAGYMAFAIATVRSAAVTDTVSTGQTSTDPLPAVPDGADAAAAVILIADGYCIWDDDQSPWVGHDSEGQRNSNYAIGLGFTSTAAEPVPTPFVAEPGGSLGWTATVFGMEGA